MLQNTDNSFYQRISRAEFFQGIPVEEIQKLFESVRMKSRNYSKKQVIHHQGIEYNQLLFVSRGKCQGELDRSSGKILIVEEFPAPAAIAPGILFARNNHLPVSLVAATDVEMISVPKEDVFGVWFRNEKLLSNFLSDISEKIFLLSRRLEILSFTTIRAKLAWFFLSRGRESFVLQSSLDELARYLGITRPSLSRSLAELTTQGLIQKDKRQIRILNRPALEALLE